VRRLKTRQAKAREHHEICSEMNERTVTAFLVAAMALVLASGCEGVVREGSPGGAEGWKLGSDLKVIAGSLDSPPELSFHQVAGAARLGGGEIVVLDGGLRSRLTVLTSDGEFLTTIGRNGEGPGEFGWVTSIQAGANDSLFIFDAGQQRLTVFARDGAPRRTSSYRPVAGEQLGSVTHLRGQSWLGRGLDLPLQGPVHEIVRDTIVLGLLDPELDSLELLATLPSAMSTTIPIGDRVGFGAAAFSPRVLHATAGGCIFVSTADTSSIQIYTADGTYLTSFEGPGTPRAVSKEHLDSWVADRLRTVPADQKPEFRRALAGAAHADGLPYYHQMLTDPWGYIWLQEYSPPRGLGDRWYVLTQSGEVAAEVVFPTPFVVFVIDEHGFLGVKQGEFDEALIVELPIVSRPLEGAERRPECQG
jgi:6-bladed beta-propeller protein